jgi:hypothetical protein
MNIPFQLVPIVVLIMFVLYMVLEVMSPINI